MSQYHFQTYRSHISVWLSLSRLVWSWPVPRSSLFCLMCLCEGFLVLLSAWYFCIAAWLPSPLSDDSGETLRRFLLKEERGQYRAVQRSVQYRGQYSTKVSIVQYSTVQRSEYSTVLRSVCVSPVYLLPDQKSCQKRMTKLQGPMGRNVWFMNENILQNCKSVFWVI